MTSVYYCTWSSGRAGRWLVTVARISLQSSCELLEGLERAEIVLHYQPIFGVASGRIERFEALSRWDHPRRGHLLPAEFIDLTENDGVGMAFTDAVIRRAVSDCVSWRADGVVAGVAVNVSPRLLLDRTLPELVAAVLGEEKLDAGHLTIELTEGAGGVPLGSIADAVDEFASMGVRVSLDDFGCAESSLARLQVLPLAEIKIDRRFVTALPGNATDATIVRFTAGLARELGLEVVAEGVEHPGALDFLRRLPVNAVQGYLLARPGPIDSLPHR